MPDLLRAELINRQDETDRATTRDALAALTFAMVDASDADEFGGVTIGRVSDYPPAWERRWAEWRAGLPRTSYDREPLFENAVGKSEVNFGRREIVATVAAIALGFLVVLIGVAFFR